MIYSYRYNVLLTIFTMKVWSNQKKHKQTYLVLRTYQALCLQAVGQGHELRYKMEDFEERPSQVKSCLALEIDKVAQ